jgi:hypothetical protein
MANGKSKSKGIVGEIAALLELTKKGYIISLPYGDNASYDLIIDKGDSKLYRAQVKYTTPDEDGTLPVTCRSSHSEWRYKYTSEHIDLIIAYDPSDGKIYYIPSSFLGEGRTNFSLRKNPTKDNQQKGIHWAKDFENF